MKKYELTTVQGKNVVIDVSQLLKEEVLYINATKLSKQFGKTSNGLYKFLNSDNFKEYENAVKRITKKGDTLIKKNQRGKYAGTYIHSDLIIYFLRWLDVDFAVICDMYIKGKIQKMHNDKITAKAIAKANLANESYFTHRQDGKIAHKSYTDTIQKLCEYAQQQKGSNKSTKCHYFKHFQSLVYNALGLEVSKAHSSNKDIYSPKELEDIEALETKIAKEVSNFMDYGLFYKNIYIFCKAKIELLKEK